MLAELHIRNLLLIAEVNIEFAPGLSVLTGETGAGKTLLLDALDFLLGARGDPSLVRAGAEQAEVSARFLIADPELAVSLANDFGIAFGSPEAPIARSPEHPIQELVLARAMPREGRARAYANGRPIALPALRDLSERLLDVHGQNENQSLLRPATRLEILDRFAGAVAERAEVRRLHAAALAAAHGLAELRRAARERQGREDMLRFQMRELQDAQLDDLAPDAVEGEVRLLRDAEKIRAAAQSAAAALDNEDGESAASLLARAVKSFSALGDAGPDTAALRERLDSLLAETRDAAASATALAEKARSDPERLAALEERRNRLRTLERKYGRDLAGLRELREKLAADLTALEQIEVHTEQCETDLAKAIAALRDACAKLTRKRKAAARDLEKRVNAELAELGLKGAKLQVALVPLSILVREQGGGGPTPSLDDDAAALVPAELKATGAEAAEILFSANADIPARPLKECASGGEISRVMLALKTVLARVSGADRLPVVVFDEVDAGVGGRLGGILGRKLSGLARVRQVLCVTHLPQMAVFAQRQFRVHKAQSGGAAAITVAPVENGQRVEELAVMLRGASASAHTRAEAAAMLREAQESLAASPRKRA
jgi:DNA repair protein RecN (Recombination protein N)